MIVPTFTFEEQYWQQGISLVAGIDEVGMGALAGPVVAAAVIFENAKAVDVTSPTIRDSKTLSLKQRSTAATFIQNRAVSWAIGEASVEEIGNLNIRGAAHLAMRRAVDTLTQIPQLLLIDGTPAQPHPHIPASNIIDGDALSFSIAAASILAKVYRDNLMVKLDKEFPVYGFAGHKGYGSKFHLEALKTHGVSPYHRLSYAPIQALLTKSRISIS
ncbi:MAG: ribonuclease HII [Candidatus Andersenbacteria bacterium]|nr:ribonuclease HII [Candidatus Andersenbacteria bacterium]MBI3250714.1 ribonuclease HII [Candidatus Andersenbacteria bacterium]